MADADEDAIIPSAPNASAADGDLDDETQDFRFLPSISSMTSNPSIPRRGEKDFEPHGTAAQANTLAASRQAMHNALAFQRLHPPGSEIIAFFEPSTSICRVENPRGQHFRTMGKADHLNRMHLLPEETLFLLERGTLDLRWPPLEGQGGEGWEGLPMSLQSAYAMLIGKLGLTMERYVVFAGLRRSGYVVRRGEGWYDEEDWNNGAYWMRGVEGKVEEVVEKQVSLLGWLFGRLRTRQEKGVQSGPRMVGTGFFRDYGSIYRRLSVIPYHDPSRPASLPRPSSNKTGASHNTDPPLRVTFFVNKPSTPFRKSLPPPPDFQIVVLDARSSTLPSLGQLSDLMNTLPIDPPPEKAAGQIYQKLKHGYKNVVLAIVDMGVVSYLRFSDAGFGNVKVWERGKQRGRGWKGGGSRGRGGRSSEGSRGSEESGATGGLRGGGEGKEGASGRGNRRGRGSGRGKGMKTRGSV